MVVKLCKRNPAYMGLERSSAFLHCWLPAKVVDLGTGHSTLWCKQVETVRALASAVMKNPRC